MIFLNVFIALLNVTIAFFLLRESIKMRRFQTKPDLVYYIKKRGYDYIGVIENIGNGVAYGIKTKITFDSLVENFYLTKQREEIKEHFMEFNYLAPKQHLTFTLGPRALSGHMIGFDLHDFLLEYSNDNKSKNIVSSSFRVNQYHLDSIDVEGTLALIADSIDQLSEVIEHKVDLRDYR